MRSFLSLGPVALFFTLGLTACPTHNALIQSMGYTEIRPPSMLFQPGTLVSVVSTSPFSAKIICGAEASLGPGIHTMRSATTTGALKRLNNKSFSVDNTTMNSLKDNESFRMVDTLTVTMQNAQIVELSDDDVIEGRRHRSKACQDAVRARIKAGYVITMISSALIGDLKYQVGWDYSKTSHHEMAGKSAAMVDLAVALDGDITSTAAGEISAKGLTWGVIDDEYLSALSVQYINEDNFERGTRHIPLDHIAVPSIEDKKAVLVIEN